MKILGIISGMGTRAGLAFVDKLIAGLDAKRDQDFPEFYLHNNSRIPDRTRAIVFNETSPEKELLRSFSCLDRCNAEVIVSTCITSYYFINQLKHRTSATVLNPVDLTRDKVQQEYRTGRKIGLLCTSGTLRSQLFHAAFAGTGHELLTLDASKQEELFMRSVYMDNGLKSAVISPEAYQLLDAAVQDLTRQGADLIIGGCSEVQLGLKHCTVDATYLDTMDILAAATLQAIQA
jgi:aspartate racemase